MTTRVRRPRFSRLASRGFAAQRSRARVPPLLNLKKRSCSQSIGIVHNVQSVEYTNFRNRASLPSLQNRCLKDTAIFMYKVKHGMVPSNKE